MCFYFCFFFLFSRLYVSTFICIHETDFPLNNFLKIFIILQQNWIEKKKNDFTSFFFFFIFFIIITLKSQLKLFSVQFVPIYVYTYWIIKRVNSGRNVSIKQFIFFIVFAAHKSFCPLDHVDVRRYRTEEQNFVLRTLLKPQHSGYSSSIIPCPLSLVLWCVVRGSRIHARALIIAGIMEWADTREKDTNDGTVPTNNCQREPPLNDPARTIKLYPIYTPCTILSNAFTRHYNKRW